LQPVGGLAWADLQHICVGLLYYTYVTRTLFPACNMPVVGALKSRRQLAVNQQGHMHDRR
jgi:hypothetical protein